MQSLGHIVLTLLDFYNKVLEKVPHLVKRANYFVTYRENVYFLRRDVMSTQIAWMERMKSDVEHLGKIKSEVEGEMVRIWMFYIDIGFIQI